MVAVIPFLPSGLHQPENEREADTNDLWRSVFLAHGTVSKTNRKATFVWNKHGTNPLMTTTFENQSTGKDVCLSLSFLEWAVCS